MYHKLPKETMLQKGLHFADQGLKIYGTAKGLYEAGSAIASAVSSGYQVAAPMLAML